MPKIARFAVLIVAIIVIGAGLWWWLGGDHVTQGQLLARLDTSRLAPQVAKAEADLAAQAQTVDRLHHGNRPEEIAQARATRDAAAADAENARAQFARLRWCSNS